MPHERLGLHRRRACEHFERSYGIAGGSATRKRASLRPSGSPGYVVLSALVKEIIHHSPRSVVYSPGRAGPRSLDRCLFRDSNLMQTTPKLASAHGSSYNYRSRWRWSPGCPKVASGSSVQLSPSHAWMCRAGASPCLCHSRRTACLGLAPDLQRPPEVRIYSPSLSY